MNAMEVENKLILRLSVHCISTQLVEKYSHTGHTNYYSDRCLERVNYTLNK